MDTRVFKFLSLFTFLLSTNILYAQTEYLLKVGDPLPSPAMTDQFGKDVQIPNGISKIIFIADMDASKLTHPVFSKETDSYLEANKAIFISDIHKMPSVISKFVAIPKMKEYPYTIYLIKEEKIGDPFPRVKGQVTMIQLKEGKISHVTYGKDEMDIRSFLESKPIPSKK